MPLSANPNPGLHRAAKGPGAWIDASFGVSLDESTVGRTVEQIALSSCRFAHGTTRRIRPPLAVYP